MNRPGFQMSLVLKHGIKVIPIGLGAPGAICYWFHIKVVKTGKDGKEIEVKSKNPNKRYPAKPTKDEVSVWEKIEQIYSYYYKKLKQ